MTTLAADQAAEKFLSWVQDEQLRRMVETATGGEASNQERFSSYGEAHREWLVNAGGLDAVESDYCLATQTVLQIVARLNGIISSDMPLGHSGIGELDWDHMTLAGFYQLVDDRKISAQQPAAAA